MALNVEVFYDFESWWLMVVDEDERKAGDWLAHRTRSEAIKAAEQYGMPVHIYTKSQQLLKIKHPPFEEK